MNMLTRQSVLLGSILLLGVLTGCGGSGGGDGGFGGDNGGGVPQLAAESPADLGSPEDAAKRLLLLLDNVGSVIDDIDEINADLNDVVAETPDGTFACAQGGTISLATGETGDRPNPFGDDSDFVLDIFTADSCEDEFSIDGVLERGRRDVEPDSTVFYLSAGRSADGPLTQAEAGYSLQSFVQLFHTEDSGIERVRGVAREFSMDNGSAEQLDLLGFGGTGLFELDFGLSTVSGSGRVRVDRATSTGEGCGAPGTFDFDITQDIQLDGNGAPMAGEVVLTADSAEATVTVNGSGIVVTINGVGSNFEQADLQGLQIEVDTCTSEL